MAGCGGEEFNNHLKNIPKEHLKQEGFRLTSLHPGRGTCSSPLQTHMEKRSAEGTTVIVSSWVPNQPALTSVYSFVSAGIELLFQPVPYKVCEITRSRPKRNGHSSLMRRHLILPQFWEAPLASKSSRNPLMKSGMSLKSYFLMLYCPFKSFIHTVFCKLKAF